MSFPCAPPVPALPGQPNLSLLIPVTQPPVEPPIPDEPVYVEPRFVSDFPLTSKPTLWWLATLARASYAPTADLFTRAAHAVLPGNYPVTFVPNAGLVPGYGLVKLPHGAIVVVSGTTNLGQWQQQLFASGLAEVGDFGDYPFVKAATMQVYRTSALVIDTALKAAVPNDQQVLLVGHSMGGAIAQVLHGVYTSTSEARVPPRCVTFASPKPGDQRLANFMRTGPQVFQRLQIDGDFVPALPPDLGVFQMAVPPVFRAVSQNWSRFRAAGGATGLTVTGELEGAGEPYLPLLVTGAMLAASVGLSLNPTGLHRMAAYTVRLRFGMPGGIPDSSQGVTRAADAELADVNVALTAQGL